MAKNDKKSQKGEMQGGKVIITRRAIFAVHQKKRKQRMKFAIANKRESHIRGTSFIAQFEKKKKSPKE